MWGKLIGGIVGKAGANRNTNTYMPEPQKEDNTLVIAALIVVIALAFLMIYKK